MSISNNRQISNILILGAGELGMAMLNGFVKEKERRPEVKLTVLLRPSSPGKTSPESQSRQRQLEAWGVDIVTADFSRQSEQELATIFAHYDAVINCSGFVGGKGTQLKITRAVLLAEVARYFPWQFGVDYDRIGMGSGQPVWDEQLAVRGLLRAQQRTRWVIVSTGMFTSYLFEPSFGVVERKSRRVNAPGNADYSVTLTTPEDIGQLTAKIFSIGRSATTKLFISQGIALLTASSLNGSVNMTDVFILWWSRITRHCRMRWLCHRRV